MAAKKKAAKKPGKALATTGGRAVGKPLNKLEKQLAQFAQQESEREKTVGTNRLSFRGGKFAYQGATLGKEVNIIILAYAFENAYYDVKFDPDNPSTPGCFALDMREDDLAPHVQAPNKQHDGGCAECHLNEWGSSETGSRGKGCSNRRRIVCMAADEKDYADAELAVLNIGPSSLKNWKGYVKGLKDKLGLPPFAVITNISFDEDSDYEVIEFNCSDKIKDARKVQSIMARLDEANKLALQPYDASGYAGGKSPRKSSKKKAGKKTAAKKPTSERTRSKFSRG